MLTVCLFFCDCQAILEIIFKNFLLLASVDCAPIFGGNVGIEFALRVVARLGEVVDYVLDFVIFHYAYSMQKNSRKSTLFFNFFKKKTRFRKSLVVRHLRRRGRPDHASRWYSRTYGSYPLSSCLRISQAKSSSAWNSAESRLFLAKAFS